jgi:hypothetical protein
VQKLQAAWAGRAQIAADFMSKWDSDDAWLRGQFQGEVLGWVMMTALLMLATAGASSLAAATGTWASILRALAAVDALGDVMAYVGAAARLPGTAVAVLQRRFGKVASTAAEVGGDLSDAERAISNAGKTGEIATRGKMGNAPKSEEGIAKGGYGSWGGRTFDPDAAGGPVRRLSTAKIRITPRGIEAVEKHLARFGTDSANEGMLRRLREIAAGKMHPTEVDLNFYSHELREFVRYRRLGATSGSGDNYELWNNTHSATLADYGLTEQPGVLYHPEVEP